MFLNKPKFLSQNKSTNGNNFFDRSVSSYRFSVKRFTSTLSFHHNKKYYKVTKSDENHHGFQYVDGLNILKGKFNESINMFHKTGFHFVDKSNISGCLDYGTNLREITLPIDNTDFKMTSDGKGLDGTWRANMITFGKKYSLSDIETYQYLLDIKSNIRGSICALSYATKNGYTDIVKFLIDDGGFGTNHQEFSSAWKNHLLTIACENGHRELIDYYIECGANASGCNYYLIEAAAKNGHLDIVKFLIGLKGDNVQTGYDVALKIASKNGQMNIVEYIVENHIDIDLSFALSDAFKNGHLTVAKYLVENGAELQFYYNNLLMSACYAGHLHMIEYLFENNQNKSFINEALQIVYKSFINEALQIVSMCGIANVAKCLIDNGADVHSENNQALLSAYKYSNFNIAKVLIDKGADANLVEKTLRNKYEKSVSPRDKNTFGKILINLYLHRENEFSSMTTSNSEPHKIIATINYLLKYKIDIDTIFNWALPIKSVEVAKYLIDNAGICMSTNGNRALVLASAAGHLDVVEYLIENGFDVHTEDDDALISASKSGHLETVKYLVGKGANIQTQQNLPFRSAVENNHPSVAKYLIENGADTNAQHSIDKMAIDNYAMHQFIQLANFDMIKYLIEKGAEFSNSDYSEALQIACFHGNIDMVKYLIEKDLGFDCNYHGAFIHAIKGEHTNIIDYLIETESKPKIFDRLIKSASECGNSHLVMYAIKNDASDKSIDDAFIIASENGNLDIVKYFIKNRNISNSIINLAFVGAVNKGYLGVTEFLVDNGADVHTNNDSAIITASRNGHLKMVEYLVDKGADVNARNGDALFFACENNHLLVVKPLIEKGADINANNNRALISAINKHNISVVKYLIEKGANVSICDNKTISWYCRSYYPEMIKLLITAGAKIDTCQ